MALAFVRGPLSSSARFLETFRLGSLSLLLRACALRLDRAAGKYHSIAPGLHLRTKEYSAPSYFETFLSQI